MTFDSKLRVQPIRYLTRIAARVLLTATLVGCYASQATAQWTTSGNNINNTNSGNVGVGTASPEQALHVEGTEVLSTGTQSGFKFRDRAGGATNNWVWYSTGNTARLHRQSVGDFLGITQTGNFGVGTTNPANAKMHVRSGASGATEYVFGGNPELTLESASVTDLHFLSPNTGSGRIWFGSPSSNVAGGLLYTHNATLSSGVMRFITGGNVTRMVILGGGNVGVGTETPGYKLEVAGVIHSSTGGFRFPDGTVQTTAASGGGGGTSQWTTTGSNIYYNSGNVGIGTTAPAGRLEVKSAASTHNSLILNTTTAGFADSLVFQEAGTGKASIQHNPGVGAGALLFNTNGIASPTNTRMMITSGGTVGIGTTSPNASYKLDVNGNTNVTGNINLTGTINAKYQDVAEWVPSTHALRAGTVVTLDPTKSNHVEASSKAYDTRVAGVVSAQPGIALGEAGQGKVLVATTGRVRIKVDASDGPIEVGDLLVSSNVPGVAMKSKPIDVGGVQIHRPGTLIGKALEPLAKGQGEILVLLSLQ
jgi:hypothetical protein